MNPGSENRFFCLCLLIIVPPCGTQRGDLIMRLTHVTLSGMVLFALVTVTPAADRVRPSPPAKGVVEKVDAAAKTITIKTQATRRANPANPATSLTLTVGEQTKYSKVEIKPGERGVASEAKLADVAVGKNVEVVYEAKDGKNIASAVKIL